MENLPFKAGQLAELRSFAFGYRGAWFRCKIREISERNGKLGHISEYYDYTEESKCPKLPVFDKRKHRLLELNWTKLYQLPMGKSKRKHSELMLRPQYPPIYNEKQMPHVSEISEVSVIVCDSWKVGDLVDFFHTGCYWCGRITQIFDDEKAEIELRPPPLGEGSSYKAHIKDLRPSLDWSLQHGWTLPLQACHFFALLCLLERNFILRFLYPKGPIYLAQILEMKIGKIVQLRSMLREEDGFGHPCAARLIKPNNQGIEDVPKSVGLPPRLLSSSPISSNSSTSGEVKSASTNGCGANPNETRQADTDSRQGMMNELDSLNSKRSYTVEAGIMDLEEYINKVKWLKKILQEGISSSKNQRSEWKFVEVEPHPTLEIPK
ncbi:hypothetical protein SASPL_113715 [Salvia splendens]|uniref:Agenet domain-containing protein n=1 Tax=Salvia splendens TaxID=180675 RepID=A0A8X8XZE4_SALSN|nr:hypothetical protein SASPL_113715 [Salvia splendens]